PEDQFGAEADALKDGPEQVPGAVAQGQAGDQPAGVGVGVGGPVALEVVQHHKPLGADRDVGGQLVQDHVRVDAAPFGLGQGGAGEVVLEPGDHRAGGGLAGLDRVLAGQGGVGVGAPEAGVVDGVGGLADDDVGGAGDQGQHARGDDPQPEGADVGVDPALGDRRARLQPQLLGGPGGQLADGRAKVEDPLGGLAEQVLDLDGPVQAGRVA